MLGRSSQALRLRIIAAAVIAIEEREPARQVVPRAVARSGYAARRMSMAISTAWCAIDAERQQRRARRQRGDLGSQIGVAARAPSSGCGLFSGGRHLTALVMRQSTSLQAVVGSRRTAGRFAKPIAVQRFVEQDAGVVPGERAAGAVRAVHAGREPDDEEPRPDGAERRDRPRVVAGMRRRARGRGARARRGHARHSSEKRAALVRGHGTFAAAAARPARDELRLRSRARWRSARAASQGAVELTARFRSRRSQDGESARQPSSGPAT